MTTQDSYSNQQSSESFKDSSFNCEDTASFVHAIQEYLHSPPDLIIHSMVISSDIPCQCVFFETLTDKNKIEHELLSFLAEKKEFQESFSTDEIIAVLKGRIPFSSVSSTSDFRVCIDSLLKGACLIIVSGAPEVLWINVSQTSQRSVAEPMTESTVRGPQVGFTEEMAINLSLIRKRVRNEHLCIQEVTAGTETDTKISIIYMNNLASNEVIEEFRKRLDAIHTDSILDSAYVEEWLKEKSYSPFSTLLSTERPDIITSHLLEGGVGVLVDGSPIALVGPITFFQFFIAPEDYYQSPDIATMLRWIRFLSFMLSIFVPALYVAVVSYQQELLPHSLLISIAGQREGVPFPAFVEAMLMMITFEVLREAGLRMPRIAGQAISIVGALVLGQAAVTAGLVSTAMVIVVSITAISNFVAPSYSFGITQRILQFFYLILAGAMGLFGVLCAVLLTVVHLASMNSFNVPYLSPVAPTTLSDWKDILIRVPRPWMREYPKMKGTKRRKRRRGL
ncbi:spore germination protein [Paenibacillus taichungensis]|uniref:Spore germination protein n=1 Tax=Paenibacillus taichungensis TaxID=484184 RepID=A0ABX2MQ82_9BACL|nr:MULTISPECIES: spore germination protein [Paenibacillus]MDR9746035.1 spore germination protein [Paenibacillus taichungensis]MEC0111124.1 spore germination protein [Paenibacillus taichungensis]MEC0196861.1 spore germination protein [Paenibacillus taichungensis]NUU56185.1 spore germination protein [Paenibacillus taichungensis]PIH55832.1 spore germination protein [Paenibacillus sp. LK1]